MGFGSDELAKMLMGDALALAMGYLGAVLRFRKTLRDLEQSFGAARSKLKHEYALLEQRVQAIEDENLREVMTRWMQTMERALGRIEGALGLPDRE
jgi:hypothetical protein